MPASPAHQSTGKFRHENEDGLEKDEKRIHFGSLEGQVDAIVSQQQSKVCMGCQGPSPCIDLMKDNQIKYME